VSAPRYSLRVSQVWHGEVMGDRVLPTPVECVPTSGHFLLALAALGVGIGVLFWGLLAGRESATSGLAGVAWMLVPVAGLGSLGFGVYYVTVVGAARRRAAAGHAVTVGATKGVTFVTPDVGLPPRFAMFRLGPDGYVLTLGSGMSGALRLGGVELEVEDFLARGSDRSEGATGRFRTTPVRAGDWGVIHLDGRGDHTVFFQFVPDEAALPRALPRDWELLTPAFVFSLVLHATLVATMLVQDYDGGSFVFPGDDVLLNAYLVQRPAAIKFEEPKAGADDGDPEAPPASTVGESGKSGGEGDKPRHRAPDPDQGSAEDPVIEKVRDTGLLRHAKTFDKVAQRGGFDERLGNAMARLQGPMNDGSAGGTGRGRGTGVGPGEGTGTTRGGSGQGPGGGGTAHADVVTQGEIKTGGTRAPRGRPGGRGVAEVAVSVTTGDASGDFGGLSKDQVDRVVQSRRNALRACYERELQRNPTLGGKLLMVWKIDAGGAVVSANVQSSSLRSGAVEDCIVRQIQRMRFPRAQNGSPTLVKYPLIFEQR
jgi:hypothetical protein